MRVDVTPRNGVVEPGRLLPVSVTITNTGELIGGYTLRVLGADPSWVRLETERVSLFPGTSQTVLVRLAIPDGLAAGERRIAIQVRELTEPHAIAVEEIEVLVPAAPAVHVQLDPVTVYGGRRASFGAVVENRGNTTLTGQLGGTDAEDKLKFAFAPETIRLAPGEHRIVELTTRAKRPLTGSPAVRVFTVHLRDPETAPAAANPEAEEPPALATGTFLQRPWLSRGPISLVGLLAAVTVFAIVLTVALARLVGQSAADRDLALQVAQARNATGSAGTASISGTVRLLTSGTAMPGVAVEAFRASDVANAVATTATNNAGAFTLPNLADGAYKLRFRGAGFLQVWYPGAATDADASTVTLQPGQQLTGLSVRLGGVPGTISGTVTGADLAGATVYLELPGSATAAEPANTDVPGTGEPIVRTVPVGSDGLFTIANVPSPSVYDLVVSKTGFANDVQRVDLAGGENRKGISLRLRQGDGLISGQVDGPTGGLGGATITATSGGTVARTVSLTQDQPGAFTLVGLPTPASFTLVVSKDGYASQTLTVTLAAGEKLTGVAVSLGASAGSLGGTVRLADGAGAAGVTVTVSNGVLTVQTVTDSSEENGAVVGGWTVGGLTIPSTYTVTFSRADLASQTVSVSLDQSGDLTPGSGGALIGAGGGIEVSMRSATASVSGTVKQRGLGSSVAVPVGEVQISLVSGTSTFTVTSASVPAAEVGRFEIDGVPPGTYTMSVNRRGTSPVSSIVTLTAGRTQPENPVLASPAGISGVVATSDGQVRAGWQVRLYLADQYPTVVARTTTTNSAGRYTFADVDAPQSYVLEARPSPSNAPLGSVTEQIDPSEQLTADIAVSDGG